ncbi:hypothetical protein [Bradyrhizobium sp. JYMT SZCCT0180]|uniref:hypothetical protein n=1 Tax=Bradyrhizobium sp. JYMT SZCCT0180 TaxID=2807666 RepID=UPI001BACB604|nr:hypothetical protein [Bradyrhizobium sp. JYMT SZCCT0180]MBR1215985.1 hypothetical protein [Bradyrhizobium sp. JYMT SZCCT0180]
MAEVPKSSKGSPKYNRRPPIHSRNAGRMHFSATLAEIAHIPNGAGPFRVIRVAFGTFKGWVGGYPTANEMGLPPS